PLSSVPSRASWAAFTHGLPAVRMRARNRVRQSGRLRSAQAPSNSATITTSIHMPGLTTCAGARPTSALLPPPGSLNVRLGPGPVPARGLTDEGGQPAGADRPPRQTGAGPGAPGDDHGIGVGHAAAGDSAASGGLRTPCNGDIDLRSRACGELSPHDDTGQQPDRTGLRGEQSGCSHRGVLLVHDRPGAGGPPPRSRTAQLPGLDWSADLLTTTDEPAGQRTTRAPDREACHKLAQFSTAGR